ncbi:MAG: glycosyltransferase family 87 protein [Promethearchaeati archaeon]
MNLEGKLIEFRKKISNLWKYPFFKIAILVQIGYIIVSIILFLTIFYSQNDFIVFYNAGNRLLFDIDNLYLKENNIFFFRYFPLSAIFYIPFSLLDFNIGFLSFMAFNLIMNIGICYFMYKIIELIKNKEKIRDDRVARYFALFLGASPQVNNYILGQNNLIVIFLILWAIYLILKKNTLKWDFFASILIGISTAIKPITLIAVPFLIVLNYSIKERKFNLNIKKSIIRLIGISIFLLPNIIFFAVNPKLWEGFLNNNFAGTNIIELRHSFSITKLIINMLVFYNLPVNQTLILLVLLSFFGSIGLILVLLSNHVKKTLIYGLTLGIIIMLLVYFDSWDHHLLIILPLLIIIIFDMPEDSEIKNKFIKPGVIYYVFLDLVFMGIWYLIKPWFPYNFLATVFLILNFYGISKYLFKNQCQKEILLEK